MQIDSSHIKTKDEKSLFLLSNIKGSQESIMLDFFFIYHAKIDAILLWRLRWLHYSIEWFVILSIHFNSRTM